MPQKLCPTLTALALVLAGGGALAQETTGNGAEVTAEVVTETAADAGAYIAARVAEANSDFRAAAAWYDRALLTDPGNPR